MKKHQSQASSNSSSISTKLQCCGHFILCYFCYWSVLKRIIYLMKNNSRQLQLPLPKLRIYVQPFIFSLFNKFTFPLNARYDSTIRKYCILQLWLRQSYA